MAPPPKRKSSRNRVVLAIGAVALLVLGYLWYQNRAGGSGTSPFSTGAASGQATPGAADTGSSGAAPDTSSADLLAALAGENQQLLGSLLSSAQGLRSLAGASLGAPTSSLTAGEPSSVTSFVPQAAVPDNQVNVPQPSPAAASFAATPDVSAASAATGPSYPEITFTPPPAQQPAGTPLPADAFTTTGAPASPANPFGTYPTLSFTPIAAPAPASHPPSSAQHYTAQTGAIRAGRAG